MIYLLFNNLIIKTSINLIKQNYCCILVFCFKIIFFLKFLLDLTVKELESVQQSKITIIFNKKDFTVMILDYR